MNKPASAPRTETVTPVVLMPNPSAPEPQPRKRRVWVVVGIAALAVAAAAFAAWRYASTGTSVQYTTAAVTRGDITRAVTATGTVNPVLTIIVGSYVSGVIKEIHCDYNTEVKVGEVCAKIDPAPYQTVVDQNRANLAVARAQLAAAEVNLGYTNIVSPVNGTVVSRNVTVGQTVAASFQTPTLFLIATDLTQMQVDTNVSESDIGGIANGNRATFTVDAFPKRSFRGAVSQVRQSPQTVQNVVTYDVVVSVDNKDLALKPGMTAATRLIVDQRRDVLRVPSQALRYSPPSAGAPAGGARRTRNSDIPARVYVLRDNAPVAVPVTVGLDDDSFT